MSLTEAQEAAWILAMVELEEKLGPLVPGGAQGGTVARTRRAVDASTSGRVPTLPAPYRDEWYCPNCHRNTTHECRDSGHERDSSGDTRTCTECNSTWSGITMREDARP